MAQILVPIQDQAVGTWTATPLWSKVDDDSTVNPSGDGVTIASADNTSPDNADLKLVAGVDPGLSIGHIIRARWHKSGSGGHAITAVAELWQGIPGTGTLIATLSAFNISEVEFESTLTLTANQANSINDYSDLYIRVSRQGDTGGGPSGRRSLVIDLVELEIPSAPTQIQIGGTITPAGALTTQDFPAAYTKYYPDSDIDIQAWTTAPLWSKVDDDPTNAGADSDIISNPPSDQGGGAPCILGLPNIPTPDTFLGWRIRVRARINSSGRTRTIRARIVKDADWLTSPISKLPPPVTLDSTSYQWIEFPVVWDWGSNPDLFQNPGPTWLDQLAIQLDPGGSEFFVNVNVSAVELLVPFGNAHPFGTPSWSDVQISGLGRSGPYLIDGNYYALGYDPAEKVGWIFKATAPADGHVPSDWTRLCPAVELPDGHRFNQGLQPADRAAATGLDMVLTRSDELAILATSGTSQRPHVALIIDPTIGTYGQTNHLSPDANIAWFGRTIWVEDTVTIDNFKALPDIPAGSGGLAFRHAINQAGVAGTALTQEPHQVFDAIAADGRFHGFYGKTEAVEEDGVRMRTLRADLTLEPEPGADFLTEDHRRTGSGAAYTNGTVWRVVSAYPQVDGGGISAIAFDSADTPTKSVEIVTTRNAYKAAYEWSVIAVPFGSGTATKMVVFWIDAATDSVRAAFRNDGESTWTDLGDLVAGSAGRTRLSVWRVDADTAAILVDDGTGPEFYTVNLALGGGATFPVAVAGTLNSSAEVIRKPSKILGAFILNQPSGTLTPLAKKLLTGTVTPSGTVRHPIQLALTAVINAVGVAKQSIGKLLAGSTAPTADVSRETRHTQTGSTTPAGDVSRETKKLLTGDLTLSGVLRRSVATLLEGAITSTGQIASAVLKLLAGAISPVGTSDHQIVEPGGPQTITVGGTLTATGDLLRYTAHTIDGLIAPDGIVARYIAQIRDGSITPTGAFGPMTVSKIFSSNVTPAGTVSRYIAHLLIGSIEPAAQLASKIAKALGSTLTSAAAVALEINPSSTSISLAGSLALAGDRLTQVGKALDGAITPASEVTKTARMAESGTITPTGAVSTAKRAILAISGTLNMAAGLTKATLRRFAGTITPQTALRRRVSLGIASTLAATGALAKHSRRTLTAAITFTSTVATEVFATLAGPISKLIRGQTGLGRIRGQGRSSKDVNDQ